MAAPNPANPTNPKNDSRDHWRQRFSVDPLVHHGEPCIAGTQVSISVIVGSIADGDTQGDLLKSYPQLTAGDISAA